MRKRLMAAIAVVGLLAWGCVDRVVTDQSVGTSQELTLDETISAKGVPSERTVRFGKNQAGTDFFPPGSHDASFHAKDAIRPRVATIAVGGTVTFEVMPFHKVAIYEPGKGRHDVDITSLEDSGVPQFPPIINDADGRIVRSDLVLPGPDEFVPFAWTFDEPGRYLVICEVLPHFEEAGMYSWVDVK